MSLGLRYKPKPERKDRLSIFNPLKKNVVYPLINDNDEQVDINQIKVSFGEEPERKITAKSLGNYLRHTRGSQIHNNQTLNSSKVRGGKKNKKTKKHKSRKNKTKRRRRF
jgi:hypothetical protein